MIHTVTYHTSYDSLADVRASAFVYRFETNVRKHPLFKEAEINVAWQEVAHSYAEIGSDDPEGDMTQDHDINRILRQIAWDTYNECCMEG